ncbi:MAG: CBS domain-containing protein [Bacteroidota bacterium]|nr:CBS domain-containing protein [Bacteroidota bacterium]MDP4227441.1 CBS domain-containing protein [Bacteroidota bacterium]MDP4273546.1 CBS domain-containing protein [Bacteroidota bacterium]
MLAKELISDIIPSLRTSDTGMKALFWMDVFRVSHLPIVNEKVFLGLISDADIYDLNMFEEPIGNHNLSLFSPFVEYDQHIYDVIELVAKLKLSLVPVLDKRKNYMGVITLSDLVQHFANVASLKDPGGLLVLDLNVNDYSLTEIAQIVEGNDAKILGLYITSPQNSTRLELTLKINKADLSPIIQTFNRYNYVIKASFMDEDKLDALYDKRYEEFIKYLNI